MNMKSKRTNQQDTGTLHLLSPPSLPPCLYTNLNQHLISPLSAHEVLPAQEPTLIRHFALLLLPSLPPSLPLMLALVPSLPPSLPLMLALVLVPTQRWEPTHTTSMSHFAHLVFFLPSSLPYLPPFAVAARRTGPWVVGVTKEGSEVHRFVLLNLLSFLPCALEKFLLPCPH